MYRKKINPPEPELSFGCKDNLVLSTSVRSARVGECLYILFIVFVFCLIRDYVLCVWCYSPDVFGDVHKI